MWDIIIIMIKGPWHPAHSFGRNYRTLFLVGQMDHPHFVQDYRTTKIDGQMQHGRLYNGLLLLLLQW
ncbi:hypothetical protein CEXT_329201 [Caerostris extrusa]|uniref:Uncharacterized protein n=1 Tax=Caerostris extrusa TaxID=172846 RepID=A0AAV4U7R5_CAEEX|nr:hypothetical protein CEXT_329201 [Caerostris extrusa]